MTKLKNFFKKVNLFYLKGVIKVKIYLKNPETYDVNKTKMKKKIKMHPLSKRKMFKHVCVTICRKKKFLSNSV